MDDRAPDELTADQQRILGAIRPRLGAGFSAHLVFGVTGSGKTAIYIRLIEHVLRIGRAVQREARRSGITDPSRSKLEETAEVVRRIRPFYEPEPPL